MTKKTTSKKLLDEKKQADPSEVCFLLPSFYLHEKKAPRAIDLVRNYAVLSIMMVMALLFYALHNDQLANVSNTLEGDPSLSSGLFFVLKMLQPCLIGVAFALSIFAVFENSLNLIIKRPKALLALSPFYGGRKNFGGYLKALSVVVGSGFVIFKMLSLPSVGFHVPYILIATSIVVVFNPRSGPVPLYWLGVLNMFAILSSSFFYMLTSY